MLQVATLTREFTYNGLTLPDPGPNMTPEMVRDMFSAAYPEITSAAIEGPERKGDKLCYVFKRAVGTKGAIPLYVEREADGCTYIKVAPASRQKSVVRRMLEQLDKKVQTGLDRLAFFVDNYLFRY